MVEITSPKGGSVKLATFALGSCGTTCLNYDIHFFRVLLGGTDLLGPQAISRDAAKERGLRTIMTTVVSVAIRNSLIREGVRRILSDSGFDLVESVDDLAKLAPREAPDRTRNPPVVDARNQTDTGHVIVVDGSLLGNEGAGVVAETLHRFPAARVVALVSSFEFTEMASIYAAGAYAYFLDQVPYQSLVAMMQMVAVGQKVAPPEIIGLLDNLLLITEVPAQHRARQGFDLSEREWDVLGALERGLPNKTISRDIGISESAVKATVKSLLKKLSVSNRTQAAVLARELGSDGAAGVLCGRRITAVAGARQTPGSEDARPRS